MNIKKLLLFITFFFALSSTKAQYQFSGYVDNESQKGNIYLSAIDDYRKISGVYPEQIINKTVCDTSGYFFFSGDNLPVENKIYRIHVDSCIESEQNLTHYTGRCPTSKEIVFIAKNTDSLSFPFSFDNEMFCRLISKNEKSNAFLKIDSLKQEMRFAFSTYRSEANRRINSKKWFDILQNYGEQLQEPLAELYVFKYLSERTQPHHAYYLEDLKNNSYYDNLLERLNTKYPNSHYTNQYKAELAADKYLVSAIDTNTVAWWVYILVTIALLSVITNIVLYKKLKNTPSLLSYKEEALSNQEKKVLELILENKSNKEIASQMFVSLSTVKTHINNLYKKLNVSSRDEVKKMYSK